MHTIPVSIFASRLVDRYGYTGALVLSASWMEKTVDHSVEECVDHSVEEGVDHSVVTVFDYWGKVYGECNDLLGVYLASPVAGESE